MKNDTSSRQTSRYAVGAFVGACALSGGAVGVSEWGGVAGAVGGGFLGVLLGATALYALAIGIAFFSAS